MTDILDARGVAIEPGDTVIYGFSEGGGVAMAEAVVLAAEPCDGDCDTPTRHQTVSLTPSGRVRLRIVRRSCSNGEKPVVDVAPDRLVVLKPITCGMHAPGLSQLPASPLPTHAEKARKVIQQRMDMYKQDLLSTEVSWGPFETVGEMHVYASDRLAELRRKLRALDD